MYTHPVPVQHGWEIRFDFGLGPFVRSIRFVLVSFSRDVGYLLLRRASQLTFSVYFIYDIILDVCWVSFGSLLAVSSDKNNNNYSKNKKNIHHNILLFVENEFCAKIINALSKRTLKSESQTAPSSSSSYAIENQSFAWIRSTYTHTHTRLLLRMLLLGCTRIACVWGGLLLYTSKLRSKFAREKQVYI